MATFSKAQEIVLDERLAELEKVRQWSPRVISKLETFIRTVDDYDLFRVNPISFAAAHRIAEQEAIDLFLYAVKSGLFEVEWHLICKMCGQICNNFRTMEKLHGHFTCMFCSLENTVFLDDYIQVAFTISRHIRELVFHQPDQLEPMDFFLKYSLSKGILPIFGIPYYDLMRSLTQLAAYVEPGTSQSVEYDAVPGFTFACDMINQTGILIFFHESGAEGTRSIIVNLTDGQFSGVEPALVPHWADNTKVIFNAQNWAQLPSGRVRFEVHNDMDTRGAVWLLHGSAEMMAAKPYNEYEPFLSGKELLSNQTFRDLFRTEVVRSDEGVGVQDITFMFTDLKGSTALYDQIGDAKAYYLVRQHFDTLSRVVAQHKGAVVKTIGDAVMATFLEPHNATAAALEMLTEIDKFNAGISEKLILKIGIHRGHSIVVTLNDRLDYFGQTVNIASRVQNLADASEIVITEQVKESKGLEDLLTRCISVKPEVTMLRGIGDKMQVYRLQTEQTLKV